MIKRQLNIGIINYSQVNFRREIVTLSLSKGARGEFLKAGFDRLSLTESRTDIDRVVVRNPDV